MTELVLAGLIVAVAVLWLRVMALAERVRLLEPPRLLPFPPQQFAPPVEAPEPAAWSPPVAVPVPAAPPPAPTPLVPPTPPMREVPPVPVEEPAPAEPAAPRPRVGFEELFGRRLPIWAGGVTLAVCGVLIVKYSIEAGLLSPLVRVIAGLLFGFGLLAGAEAARQNGERVRDPRVAQALAGAGVATLYATTLVATDLYGLLSPLAGFVGLALVTVAAGLLALRYGAPSAVLGLVGGLAAPALVGAGSPVVPLLSAYLGLTITGLAGLGRARRWPWLGALAIAGGFGWGALMLASGPLDDASTAALGLYLLALGVVLPTLIVGGAADAALRWAGTLLAAAGLAAVLEVGGFRPLDWGLYALLAAASVWLSTREQALRDLPGSTLAIALLLMLVDPQAAPTHLAALLGGAAAIVGPPALWRVWRADGRPADAGQLALLAGAVWFLPWIKTGLDADTAAQLALAGAAAAAAVAALGWRATRSAGDARLALLAGTAATLTGIAAWTALPAWAREPALAGIGLVLLALARPARDEKLDWLGCLAATIAGTLLLVFGGTDATARALGWTGHGLDPFAALRWGVPALAAGLFASRSRTPQIDPSGAIGGVLLGYVAAAQLVPTPWLPLVPAAALAALGWTRRPLAATATAAALTAGWALFPLAQWLAGAGGALAGVPFLVTSLPSLGDAATRLLAPAAAAVVLLRRDPPARRVLRQAWAAGAALLAGVAVHVAYKHLFALADGADFIGRGLAERTVWEAALAAAAAALWTRVPRVARWTAAAAGAHLVWFTLLLHDPLWSAQAVGPLPIVNLLLPVYVLAFALLRAAALVERPAWAERVRQLGLMALVLLLAASELRQLAHGSLLGEGSVTPAEDIARSIGLVALGIGFLVWGIRRRLRDWRIASLVLMLAAAAKVFLFDAAGLDGLARIASFAALGFSLIGIGWLYSRYLPQDDAAVNPTLAPAV